MSNRNPSKSGFGDVPKYYVCSRCSYHWKPRKVDGIPRNCPSCRSTVWMKPFELKTCLRCGYEWGSTSEEPNRCPNCGTHHWNDPVRNYACLKCGHKWTPKRDWSPKRCPNCRCVTWDKDPNEETKEVFIEDPRKYVDQNLIDMILSEYQSGRSCTQIMFEKNIPFAIIIDVVRLNEKGTIRI